MSRVALAFVFVLVSLRPEISWTDPPADPKPSVTPQPAADGKAPEKTPATVTLPALTDIRRFTVRWLEQPVYTFLEYIGGRHIVTYLGGTCPRLDSCTDAKSGLIGPDGRALLKFQYDRVKAVHEKGYLVVQDGKTGLVGPDGQWLIPAKYQRLIAFGDGFFEARTPGGALELLDAEGKVILSGIDELALEQEKVFWASRGGKWGAYGLTGKPLLPHRFAEYNAVGDRVVAVRVGRRWALVDDAGRQVTPLRYHAFGYGAGGLLTFNLGGRCELDTSGCEGGRTGVMAEDGRIVLPAVHDCVELTAVGDAEQNEVEIRVITAPADADPDATFSDRCTGGRVRVYHRDGRPWLPGDYSYVDTVGDNEVLRAVKEGTCDTGGACTSGKWGLIAPDGKVLLDYRYDWIDAPRTTGMLVVSNGRWGYLDGALREVVAPKYEMLHWHKDGMRFLENGKWGLLDQAGAVVVPAKYELLMPLREGVARFLENGKWGLVSATGKVLSPAGSPAICPFNLGAFVFAAPGSTCSVKSGKDLYCPTITAAGKNIRRVGYSDGDCECAGGKFGLMDVTGRVLLKPKYQALQVLQATTVSQRREPDGSVRAGFTMLPPGQVWVRVNEGGKCTRIGTCTGGKWGLTDRKGRVIVPVAHAWIEPHANFLIRVAKGGVCELGSWRPILCSPETRWGLFQLEPAK